MLEPLNRFSDMLADMNSDDPAVRSRAAKQLTVYQTWGQIYL